MRIHKLYVDDVVCTTYHQKKKRNSRNPSLREARSLPFVHHQRSDVRMFPYPGMSQNAIETKSLLRIMSQQLREKRESK